jgi:RHS repeat-associated protein
MMPIKHMDPILGVDVHIVLIPTPAGPVPTPIPHPHVGMIMDPFDYVPIVGSTLYVNNMIKASAGTAGLLIPPSHIPMGGPFAPPPGNESEMFMGSATVDAEGDPFSFLGCPVISCMTVGMPAPIRPKKKGASVSLFAPVTQAMPIPMGLPVMVGGPPTISLLGLAMNMLGPMLGAMKKLAKKSKTVRKLVKAGSDRAHKAAKKVMDKVGVPPASATRNKVHSKICSATGHPVDVASGKMYTEHTDLCIDGPLPFEFSRKWLSCSTYQGPIGTGWHHNWDISLFVDEAPEVGDEAGVVLRADDGRYIPFLQVPIGGSFYNRQDRMSLFRDERGYRVRTHAGLTYRFRLSGAQSLGPVSEIPLGYLYDIGGQRIVLHRDDRGRLCEIHDSCGRVFSFENDEYGQLLEIVGPHPQDVEERLCLLSFAYDENGSLIEVRDALGQCERFVYKQNLMVQETNKGGLSFYFQYDQEGPEARCTRTWADGGLYDHKLTLDDELGVTFVTNSLGHKTTYHHDGSVVHKVTDAYGNESATVFDDDYYPVVETDELGRATIGEYDERGNRVQMTLPDGTAVQTEFNEFDLPTKVVDQLGSAWLAEYDDRGRVVRRIDPEGGQSNYVYSDAWLKVVTDAAGQETRYEYDNRGLLRSVHTPDGGVASIVYDQLGRRTAFVDPVGGERKYTLDLRGDIVGVEEESGNVREITRDAAGRIVRLRDQDGDVHLVYCGTDRVAMRTQSGTSIAFEYDTEEQLIGIANEQGNVYRFKVGPTGLVDEDSGFDGLLRKYTRDRAGRVTEVERPSERSSVYEYDEMDRLVSVHHDGGALEAFRYRADGAVLSARNAECLITFEHDLLGRIVKEEQEKTGEDSQWIESRFDVAGERVSLSSSMGAEFEIGRDAMGRVSRVARKCEGAELPSAKFAVDYQRDHLGLELERSILGGLKSRWKRDQAGRPLEHEIRDGRQVHRSLQYRWASDNRLQKTVDAVTKSQVTYGYSAHGYLAWAQFDDELELRMPDSVMNLFRSRDQADRKYGPAGQLLEIMGEEGITSFEYDVEGNLISKEAPGGLKWLYEWNGLGRLVKVVRPDEGEVHFVYDALGRRIAKSFRGQTTRWLWDGDVPLHEWVDGEYQAPKQTSAGHRKRLRMGSMVVAKIRRQEAELSSLLRRGPPGVEGASAEIATVDRRGTIDAPITWVFEPDTHTPVAKIVGGSSFPIITDAVGAPVGMYDQSGSQVWGGEISTFGRMRKLKGVGEESDTLLAVRCPFRWPGQYEDVETGLSYNRFRYYDSEQGHYISQDPQRTDGGFRLYGYVPNPITWIDPLGLGCGPSSPGKMQREVERGQAPRQVDRVDKGHVPGQEAHVHYTDGTSSTVSGGVHDAHKGTPNPNKKTRKWLQKHGWTPP